MTGFDSKPTISTHQVSMNRGGFDNHVNQNKALGHGNNHPCNDRVRLMGHVGNSHQCNDRSMHCSTMLEIIIHVIIELSLSGL